MRSLKATRSLSFTPKDFRRDSNPELQYRIDCGAHEMGSHFTAVPCAIKRGKPSSRQPQWNGDLPPPILVSRGTSRPPIVQSSISYVVLVPSQSSPSGRFSQQTHQGQTLRSLLQAEAGCGLITIHEPDGPPDSCVDVVLVHGLEGHMYRSWVDDETAKFWPLDFLSYDLPSSRILTFGYDARVLGISLELIDRTAQTLLEELGDTRPSESSSVSLHSVLFHSLSVLLLLCGVCYPEILPA